MYKIVVYDTNRVIESDLFPNEKIVVGRNPDGGKTIIIGDSSISRNHAIVETSGKEVYITDLNSMNGTYIDGRKLQPQQKTLLNSFAYLGSIKLEVKTGGLQNGPSKIGRAHV